MMFWIGLQENVTTEQNEGGLDHPNSESNTEECGAVLPLTKCGLCDKTMIDTYYKRRAHHEIRFYQHH